MPPVPVEVCVETVAGARAAAAGGAARVEVCSALGSEGGLSPGAGLLAGVVGALRDFPGCAVMSMVRPRGGDFLYSTDDLAVMEADVRHAKAAGADGVVFGLLEAGGEVDLASCTHLARLCAELQLDFTFHRAVDASCDPVQAVVSLARAGFRRVLTSGGHARAVDGAGTIRAMVDAVKGTGLRVMVGSGVRPDNVVRLLRETGAHEAHGSCRTEVQSAFRHRPAVSFSASGSDYTRHETDTEQVRALVAAAAAIPRPSSGKAHSHPRECDAGGPAF
tara:strand:+ start:47 stop:877 length:831 start_codon:yes stop_codon:yes gene_type:complete